MALTNRRADLVSAKDVKRIGDDQGLEVERAPRFQQREWRIQRVGWAVGVLVLALACLGLLGGNGPLAYTEARTGEGLVVEWARYARHQGHATLRYVVPASAVKGGEIEIAISGEFVRGIEIQSVVPEPASQRLDLDGIVYTFEATPGAGLTVEFDYRPESQWRRSGETGLAGGDAVRLTQFVYP